MKTLFTLLAASLLLTAPSLANPNPGQPDILLRGVLDMGANQTFSLSDQAGTGNEWLTIGQSFKGYKLLGIFSGTGKRQKTNVRRP